MALSTKNFLDVVKPATQSPSTSPVFTLHRTVSAVDTGDITDRNRGMNMFGYKSAIFRVAVKTGSPDPEIEVLFWSEEASKFISEVPARSASTSETDKNFDYVVDVLGRVVFVYVTGTMTDASIEILIAGSELDHDS